jgi:hypothetical protein
MRRLLDQRLRRSSFRHPQGVQDGQAVLGAGRRVLASALCGRGVPSGQQRRLRPDAMLQDTYEELFDKFMRVMLKGE